MRLQSGAVVRGAKDVNQANEKGAVSFAHGSKGRFEILNSGSNGTVEYWSSYQHAKARLAGKEEAVLMKLRVTELFRNGDDGWKLIHRHADEAKY